MSSLFWLLVPGAPLFAGLLMLRCEPGRIANWVWLSCVPALLLSLWPVAPLPLPALWPGAEWAVNDPLGRAWLGFSSVLWACASRFAANDLRRDKHPRRFWSCWFLALLGNLVLVIAQDAGSFYAGFTLMSLSAYGLIAHQPGPEPRQAARLYLQLAVLGEMLIYAGMLLRIHETGGTLALDAWQQIPTSPLCAVLLLVGFGLKAGFWPLHVWLPLAHPAAPAAASAVLSGAMIKAGILGLWRFLPTDDPSLQGWATCLLAIGAFGALYGVVLGLLQTRSKTLLAYSSVSQMGYLLIILALAWQQPQERDAAATLLALYAAHHALAKGALFLGAGLSTRVVFSNGHWLCLAIPALALAGLPLTSGAAIKALLKDGVATHNAAGWVALLIIGSAGTMLLMLRALWLMRTSQQRTGLASMPVGQRVPLICLCLMPVILPWLWQPLREAMLASLPLYAMWVALWPALLAVIIAALVLKKGWRLPARLHPLPNPARVVSLRLKRLLQRPPMPVLTNPVTQRRWRRSERRWNRAWQSGTVTISAWIILLLLMLGWLG